MNLKKIAAALVLLPFFILLVGWAPIWALLLLVVGLGVGGGLWEYCRIVFGPNSNFDAMLAILMGGIICLVTATLQEPYLILATLAGAFLAISIAYMLREPETSDVVVKASKSFFGVVLVGLFAGMIVALRALEPVVGDFKLLLFLFALIWINDAGAYFTGTAIGRHKLAPVISPNKTIEGSLGGFAATLLLALGVSAFSSVFTMKDGLILGLVMGVIGPLGDLFESALKRGAGVKDSGNLLPGHGGVLDRVDSVLFGAPVLYFYILFRFHPFQ